MVISVLSIGNWLYGERGYYKPDRSGRSTYKEEHLGLKHHSNGSWWGNGRSAGWDGETELHIPIQLGRLVWELEEKQWASEFTNGKYCSKVQEVLERGLVCNIVKHDYNLNTCFVSYLCILLLLWKSSIFALSFKCHFFQLLFIFRVTWCFRNNYNILIWWLSDT